MRVTVRYFAAHRAVAGVESEVLEVDEGLTVGDLLEHLVTVHDGLRALMRDTVISVNRGVGNEGTVLRDGDDVALFPPISGG